MKAIQTQVLHVQQYPTHRPGLSGFKNPDTRKHQGGDKEEQDIARKKALADWNKKVRNDIY